MLPVKSIMDIAFIYAILKPFLPSKQVFKTNYILF